MIIKLIELIFSPINLMPKLNIEGMLSRIKYQIKKKMKRISTFTTNKFSRLRKN